MKLFKKSIALLLTLALLLLCACAQSGTETEAEGFTAPTADTVTAVQQESTDLQTNGALLALVTGSDGNEGADAQLWQAIGSFADAYACTAQSIAAGGDSVDDAEAALRSAAEGGAVIVICRGETMARALYRIQDSYPGVCYLLFDDEPHSEDYTSYTTASTVHCVLFQEEQAGYLAGYAAVTEGYTALGFVGEEQKPGNVRYCTGFLQGAADAAERRGVQAELRTWYTAGQVDSATVTQRMIDWFNDGVTLIFAQGDANALCALDAVNQTGAKAITTDWDQTNSGERVLASAIKCYGTTVQTRLYSFFANGGKWSEDEAGQSERVGVNEGAVALAAGDPWRFDRFDSDEYEEIYGDLRDAQVQAENYGDMGTLPDTPEVTVEQQN